MTSISWYGTLFGKEMEQERSSSNYWLLPWLHSESWKPPLFLFLPNEKWRKPNSGKENYGEKECCEQCSWRPTQRWWYLCVWDIISFWSFDSVTRRTRRKLSEERSHRTRKYFSQLHESSFFMFHNSFCSSSTSCTGFQWKLRRIRWIFHPLCYPASFPDITHFSTSLSQCVQLMHFFPERLMQPFSHEVTESLFFEKQMQIRNDWNQ